MLALLSDLNKISTIEAAQANVPATAVQGTFVSPDGNAPADKSEWAAAIWNESTAANTWSPDVTATGNVTLLMGGYRAKTDQFDDATYVAGQALAVGTDGKLEAATVGTHQVVAYALGAKETGYSWKGSTYTVLEIWVP